VQGDELRAVQVLDPAGGVEPDDGTWSIDGLAGLGRLVDGGDVGDTYNWCPPDVD
jgi:hypothetical protein